MNKEKGRHALISQRLHSLLSGFIIFATTIPALYAQDKTTEDRKILELIADGIIQETTYDFYNADKDKVLDKITDKSFESDIRVNSPYNDWKYWNGVLNIAFLRLYETFQDERYREFPLKYYDFAFKYGPMFEENHKGQSKHRYSFGQFFTFEQLDDCGAMGAGLIEVNAIDPREEYQEYIDKAASYIMNDQDRLPDNTFVRSFPYKWTLWGDDLYMGLVFTSRYGKYYDDNSFLEDAILQVKAFNERLYDPKKEIFYHCWYSDLDVNGVAHWSRCNGWIIMAQVDLLEHLPNDHPKRKELIDLLQRQIIGLSRWQDVSGMWHQIIDKNNSYLETSGTAMFTYGIAKAINEGWIDERYIAVALEGWEGIKNYIRDDGKIENISQGTTIRNNISFYYERPTPLNDIHGIGAVLLAGNEIVKYKESKQK
ncbi:MAG: glycoside hydrolase family 88/105 protein [Bacteroidota bacterium]